MHQLIHKFRGALLLLLAGLSFFANAQNSNFPSKPVRMIAFPSAGSGADVIIRAVSDGLSKLWGQPVVVENKPGAGGTIAGGALKTSPADGYTIGALDMSALAINPHLYPSMQLQPEKDLSALSLWYREPFLLVVPTAGPIKTVPELIAYAKAHPGKLSFGSPTGVGNPSHLGMEIFKSITGTDMVFVPYKTSQALLADLSTQRLQVAWLAGGSARAMIEGGTVMAIAAGGKTRHLMFPNVPTIGEAGGPPNLDVAGTVGMFSPKGIPADIAAKITRDVTTVLNSPEVSARLKTAGGELLAGDAAKTEETLRVDSERYGKVIKALNLKVE